MNNDKVTQLLRKAAEHLGNVRTGDDSETEAWGLAEEIKQYLREEVLRRLAERPSNYHSFPASEEQNVNDLSELKYIEKNNVWIRITQRGLEYLKNKKL